MASSTFKGEVSGQLLAMLRCPRTKKPLRQADAETLDRVNRAIRAGRVQDVGGTAVEQPLDGGLVTDDDKLLYAVFDRIPVLLPDEAIDIQALPTS